MRVCVCAKHKTYPHDVPARMDMADSSKYNITRPKFEGKAFATPEPSLAKKTAHEPLSHLVIWWFGPIPKNSSHLLHDIIYANVSEISCLHPVAYTL